LSGLSCASVPSAILRGRCVLYMARRFFAPSPFFKTSYPLLVRSWQSGLLFFFLTRVFGRTFPPFPSPPVSHLYPSHYCGEDRLPPLSHNRLFFLHGSTLSFFQLRVLFPSPFTACNAHVALDKPSCGWLSFLRLSWILTPFLHFPRVAL